MDKQMEHARVYQGTHVTAAETLPFGDKTQLTEGKRYRIIQRKNVRERETGENKLMDVEFLLEDDRRTLNRFSYARFREFR